MTGPVISALMQILPQGTSLGGAAGLPTMLAQLFPDMMALNKSGQPLTGDLLQSMLQNSGDDQGDATDDQGNPSNAYDLLAALLQTAQLLPQAALPASDEAASLVEPLDTVSVPQAVLPTDGSVPELPVIPNIPEDAAAVPTDAPDDLLAVAPEVNDAPVVVAPEIPQPVTTADTQPVANVVAPLPEVTQPSGVDTSEQPPKTTTQNADALIAQALNKGSQDEAADAVEVPLPKKHDVVKPDLAQQFREAAKPEEHVVIARDGKNDKETKDAVPKAAAATPTLDPTVASRPRDAGQSADVLTRQAMTGAGSDQKNSSQQGSGQEKQDFGSALLNQWQQHGVDTNKQQLQHDSAFAKLVQAKEHTPVADQVYVQIRHAAQEGASKITIQLDPPELGKVEVRLDVGIDGKTGVVVTAENKDSLELLQREHKALERALSDAGLKTDSGSLSFNLRQNHQQQNSQHFWGYQPNGFGTQEVEEDNAVPVVTEKYVLSMTSSGLDIKV